MLARCSSLTHYQNNCSAAYRSSLASLRQQLTNDATLVRGNEIRNGTQVTRQQASSHSHYQHATQQRRSMIHVCNSLPSSPSPSSRSTGTSSSSSNTSSVVGGGSTVPFVAAKPNTITWYTCGPTVYDDSHLGHARSYVSVDIIQRILTDYFNYDVHHVMGMTDIDDKIINRANEEATTVATPRTALEIARAYERDFLADMESLGVRRPMVITRVTEHVPEIIAFIERILQNSHAYRVDSGVYFDVGNFKHYGVMTAAATVDNSEGPAAATDKRDPRDFALWKTAKPGEPFWDSPWGPGRPGWHIECSAMSCAIFGEHLDVHSGGIDLKFPHHENEIAQCNAHWHYPTTSTIADATNKNKNNIATNSSSSSSSSNNNASIEAPSKQNQWVNYFLHTGHLHIEGRKMSKSLKNFITIKEILSSYSGDQFRVFCLMSKYNSNIEYSKDRMADAWHLLQRWKNSFQLIANRLQHAYSTSSISGPGAPSLSALQQQHSKKWGPPETKLFQLVCEVEGNVRQALKNDFDTPKAMSELLSLLSAVNSYLDHYNTAQQQQQPQQQHQQQQQQQQLPPPELPLYACSYIDRMLRIFGLNILPCPFNQLVRNAAAAQQQQQAVAGSEEEAVDVHELVTAIVNFRQKLRDVATAVSDGSAKRSLFQLSDEFRDSTLEHLGIRVLDEYVDGKHRATWKYVDKKTRQQEALARQQAQQQAELMRAAAMERTAQAKIPPEKLFVEQTALYSKFDEQGIPTHTHLNEVISEKARRKLQKKWEKQKQIHEQYLQQQHSQQKK